MKKNILIIMGALLVMAWYVTLSSWLGNDGRYQECVAEAHRLEEKGLYLDAIEAYERAKELTADTLEADEYIADAYFAMGNHKDYKKQLNLILDTYGPVDTEVEKLCKFYEDYSSENSLIDCISNLYRKYPDSAVVKMHYDSIKGKYTEKYVNYDKIESFLGKYAVYELNGKRGLLDKEGDAVIEAVYDEVYCNGEDMEMITVRDGEKYFFINKDGYKTKEPEDDYEYLGMVSQKRIAAEAGGKYGYLDGSLQEKIAFSYDEVTSFHDDTAAVRQGDVWTLINRRGELLMESSYEGIAVNSMNACCVNDRICVKQNGSWQLMNRKGEIVSTDGFQDMKAFEGDEPCAVCRNGMWGFADVQGMLVIDCQYQDAKSFANGYAPVKKDGLWGFIDSENHLVIDYTFEDAGWMTADGVAPVEHNGAWTLIELKIMK